MVTSRIWFTPEQKSELWERWKQGHSISAISRALEQRRIVALHGGIAPPPRHRAASEDGEDGPDPGARTSLIGSGSQFACNPNPDQPRRSRLLQQKGWVAAVQDNAADTALLVQSPSAVQKETRHGAI